MRIDRLPISVLTSRIVPGRWDVVAIVLVFGILVYLGEAAHGLTQPLAGLEATPISLDPWKLIGYSARSALRMLIAMIASLVFTFSYATLAAKSRRAGELHANPNLCRVWFDVRGARRAATTCPLDRMSNS